jgi:isoleucyl-tRNA synthetase
MTPELRRLGLARDVVRQVQEARKSSGLEVSDRIRLAWSASGTLRDAITEHSDAIAAEVLATAMDEADSLADEANVFTDDDSGLAFTVVRV